MIEPYFTRNHEFFRLSRLYQYLVFVPDHNCWVGYNDPDEAAEHALLEEMWIKAESNHGT